MSLTLRSIFTCGLVMLTATTSFAQTKPSAEIPVAATFDSLPGVAKPGMKVVVTDLKGNAVFGKVQSVTAESVSLKIPGGWDYRGDIRRTGSSQTYEMKRESIQTVRVKPDSSLNGALIGLAAGFAGAIGIAMAGLPDDGYAGWFLLGLIPGGGLAGFYIDRALSDRRLLYAKPSVPQASFEHALSGHFSMRADVGVVVSPLYHRPAPRVAANVVISLGSVPRRNR